MAERVTYELTLRDAAAAGDAPPEQRLRALLKLALRAYGLRCTHVSQAPPARQDGQRPPDREDRS